MRQGACTPNMRDGGEVSESDLTPRELEILQAAADGLRCVDTAKKLGVVRQTVRNSRKIIMDKLGADNTVQAVAMALRRGLIQCVAIALIVSTLSGCATIHRHPKLTALVIGAAAGTAIGLATYQKPCPSHIDGYGYNGTPPCPKSCDSDGCYWPGKK